MALNIPASPTTLTAISKTGFGDPVRDSLLWVATDAPTCRVYNSANLSIPNNTTTLLTFDSERFDVGGCHSTSTNTGRITVPSGAGGKWLVGVTLSFAANATGARVVSIRLNGTTPIAVERRPTNSGTYSTDIAFSTLYSVSAGDYFDVAVIQDSGGALNVSAVSNNSPEFWACWVRT